MKVVGLNISEAERRVGHDRKIVRRERSGTTIASSEHLRPVRICQSENEYQAKREHDDVHEAAPIIDQPPDPKPESPPRAVQLRFDGIQIILIGGIPEENPVPIARGESTD